MLLEEAIRRLTSFPAENLRIHERGSLKPGFFADIAVFDPNTIQDHATYERPHQYATGMVHVFVNGEQVLRDGEHTGAKPGALCEGLGGKDGRTNCDRVAVMPSPLTSASSVEPRGEGMPPINPRR